jgi:hypothetical protein
VAYTIVANGDSPNADYFNNSLMRQTVVKCTSGTRPASPDEGMIIFETDTNCGRLYTGTGWVRLPIMDTDASSGFASDPTDVASITNLTSAPAAGSPVVGLTFFGPPSGFVWITVTGTIECANNTETMHLGYEVRTGGTIGTGTVTTAFALDRAIQCGKAVNASAPSTNSASNRQRVSATSGTQYNVRTMHGVSGGTGAAGFRAIAVEPYL